LEEGPVLQRILTLPRRRLVAAAPLLLIAACTHDLTPLPEVGNEPYRLDSGDEIRIITFGEEQLTGQFKVDDSGNIAVPLLGVVPARGLTTPQLGASIASRLKAKNLIKDASVTVEITGYRPIFVLGEVSKPGQYPYQPGMTVLTAVAVAGGFTYRAVEDSAQILRTTSGHAVEGRVGRGSYVEPGDVITIAERWL
jgi:polysaccharide biosynthesis/export protein